VGGPQEEAALQRFLALKHGRVLYPRHVAYAVREPGPAGKPVVLTEYELTYGRLISDIGKRKSKRRKKAEREEELLMGKRSTPWPYAHPGLHGGKPNPGLPPPETEAPRRGRPPKPKPPEPPAEKPRSPLASAVIYARVLLRQGVDHRTAVTRAAGSCGVPIKEVAAVLEEYEE
jgi:hypothetical protein